MNPVKEQYITIAATSSVFFFAAMLSIQIGHIENYTEAENRCWKQNKYKRVKKGNVIGVQ